jgi:hypothetical protein
MLGSLRNDTPEADPRDEDPRELQDGIGYTSLSFESRQARRGYSQYSGRKRGSQMG